MTVATAGLRLGCREPACRIAAGELCREGMDDPVDCPFFEGSRVPALVVGPAGVRPHATTTGNSGLGDDGPLGGVHEGTGEPQGAGARSADDLEDPPPAFEVEHAEGRSLTVTEASVLARSSLTRVIVLAGAAESGKTTILTSIYECFQEGPFGGYLFAGSETLPGLERRCHPSRIASERAVPTTDRTRQRGTEFVHLALRPQRGDAWGDDVRNLLLTDVSGETFRQARDFDSECRRLDILRRADHLAVSVDGARVADPAQRNVATNDARALLKRALLSGMIGRRTAAQVVWSKADVLESLGEVARAEAADFMREVETEITESFGGRLGALDFVRVAARPEAPSLLGFAYNLGALLMRWMGQSARNDAAGSPAAARRAPVRPFDAFGWARGARW